MTKTTEAVAESKQCATEEQLRAAREMSASIGGKFKNDMIDELLTSRQQIGELRKESAWMRKLYYLAANDVIFFSTYDEETQTWKDTNEFYSPCVCLNDTFAYACADGERLDPSQIDSLIHAWKTWGHHGVIAWAAVLRDAEPLPKLRTPDYFRAHDYLAALGAP